MIGGTTRPSRVDVRGYHAEGGVGRRSVKLALSLVKYTRCGCIEDTDLGRSLPGPAFTPQKGRESVVYVCSDASDDVQVVLLVGTVEALAHPWRRDTS